MSEPGDLPVVPPLSGPGPLSKGLVEAAKVRHAAGGSARSWASHKRRGLEKRVGELRRARKSGLSNKEIREILARDGIRVGRWLLEDLLREPPPPPPR